MLCPLCENEITEFDLIPNPYLQGNDLVLAHRLNPEWNEGDGCCSGCFDAIKETVHEAVFEPVQDFGIRGLKDGYRYVLSDRQTGEWNHQNPDLQRWHQKRIVEEASKQSTGAGFDEWFIFDASETILAQGKD